jgi:uncharacterized protein (TIGR00288 family)
MTVSSDDNNLAVYCDFENIALGVRDANYQKFDIAHILEKLLVKGSIVVKKAYCDWERYKNFKASMHEAAFELIDIPHVRQSGKNSADIRMVVDALDMCYTKAHVDMFVIISGDSDFSPLVSKLRENAKTVIGVGVKNSTSDLLIKNCDEFIYYDDLVRELERKRPGRKRSKKSPARSVVNDTGSESAIVEESSDEAAVHTRKKTKKKRASKKSKKSTNLPEVPENASASTKPDAKVEAANDSSSHDERNEELVVQGLDLVLQTAADLQAERDGDDKLWGSMIKQTLKRRRPGFNESYYGFDSFGKMLKEAEARGFLKLELDDRSGGYIISTINS